MDGPQPSISNMMGSTSTSAVPIEHMDYSYIRECKNIKELEKILRALRSGEDGYYPDLIDFCEKRIESLAPQSKVLRKDKAPASMHEVGKEEWQQINADIKDWATEMGASSKPSAGMQNNHDDLPPIRKPTILNTKGEQGKTEEKAWAKPSAERIKSADFHSWDKYDADAAAEAVDKNGEEKPKPAKAAPVKLESTINTEGMTDKERVTVANMEKNKGNEAFKAGDFDEAVQYYTRSISVIPSAPSYNNRSLARIKLSQFTGAVEDCTKVLELEPDNIKALLRRGTARKALKEFNGAREDLQAVLKAESNNKQAMDLLADILAKEEMDPKAAKSSPQPATNPPESKGRRMVIQEVECDSEEEEEDGKDGETVVNGNDPPDASMGGATPPKDGQEAVTKVTAAQPTNSKVNRDDESDVSMATPPASNCGSAAEPQSSMDTVVTATPPPPLPLPDDIVELKDSGNNLYKAGQYSEAMQKYSSAIAKLFQDKESFSSALGTLYGNRAACNLKTGHLKAAISDCDMALGIQPYSVKTLLRRGAAYEALESYRCAYVDYQTGLKLDAYNQTAHTGATRMMQILTNQDGPRWREKLPPSPGLYGLPLPPPTLTTMAPSNASHLATNTTTSTATSNTTPVTSVQTNPLPSQPKGQEAKDQLANKPKVQNPEVNGQEGKPQAKPQSKTTLDQSQRLNAKPDQGSASGGEKVKDQGAGVKGAGDPMPTIDPNLSTEANFQRLKADGNNLVKQGDYAAATVFYTYCIAVDASQAVSYTNRALCYIKLFKWNKAEADCSKALELNETNVKALYRRALARKMLQKFSDSARDLTSLLKIEPTNASAKKELDQVKEMWRQELKNNQQKTPDKPKQNTQPTQAKPAEVKPTEVKAAEVKPAEVKPAEVKPAEVKPAEVKVSEIKSDVTSKKKKKGKRIQIQEVEGSSEDDAEVGKSTPKTAEKQPLKEKKGGKGKETCGQKTGKNAAGPENKTAKNSGTQKTGKNAGGPENKTAKNSGTQKTGKNTAGPENKTAKNSGTQKTGKNAGGPENKTAKNSGTQKTGKNAVGPENKTAKNSGTQKTGKTTGQAEEKVIVPKLNKVTAFEFLQAWTSLKRHKSMLAYAGLLKQISPEELPEVLTNKLDGDMLVSIIKAICEHLVESDADLSFGLLSSLPKVERFKTVGLFLSTSDKKRLRNSLKKLGTRKSEAYTEKDIENLRLQYSL